MELGKLEEVSDLRTVWPHEAFDFTPWLAKEKNLELLSDAIGIDISVEEVESSVGDFHVDIYAFEEGTGKKVIIENQLEPTNHDHLGKLITYAAGKDASYLIWIVKEAREEHKAAVEWLNEHTDDETGFFLCELKLYKIGNSAPAVKFDVIEKPNDWSKEARSEKNPHEIEWEQYNRSYWNEFIAYAKQDKEFCKQFKLRKTSKKQYYDINIAGIPGHLVARIGLKSQFISMEIYTVNQSWYENLLQYKDEIEAKIGNIKWISKPGTKSNRIVKKIDYNPKESSTREQQFQWFIDEAINFKKVLLSSPESD